MSLEQVVEGFTTISTQLDSLENEPDKLIEVLGKQEQSIRVRSFDVDDAWELGSSIHAAATKLKLPVAISIVLGDQRAFHAAIPGAVADNDGWVSRKIAVVKRFGHSSFFVGTTFVSNGQNFDVDSRLPVGTYAAHGGAFPLLLESGLLIGVVGASGLPSAHDHSLVVSALTDFLATRK